MDLTVGASKLLSGSTGQLPGSSRSDECKAALLQVENCAQQFDMVAVGNIYTKLLNDESLGYDVQVEINTHLVETYKQYGDAYYERQLTTLFQNLNAVVKPIHQKINSELANKFSCVDSSHENNSQHGFKPLSIYGAHLHIASTLGDATSSLFLAKLHIVERGDEDQAFGYALTAQAQGNTDALKTLGAWCEQSSSMKGSAENFKWAAESIQVPTKPNAIEILPKEMAADDPEFTHFAQVDHYLADGSLKKAEQALREIAERHLDTREVQKLFSEEPSISSHAKDWYCDHGPIYTRVALKLAKIRWRGLELLSTISDGQVVPTKKNKVYELVQVINSVGSSETNKAIKLELGEWYLTRATLGFASSDEKQKASYLLQELNLKKIPDKYPEMQKLSGQFVGK